jgi:integrative and conjugative element protein (TIGR02256 family)
LIEQARDAAPNETGGMLVGWAVATEIVVTQVIAPGPDAIFARDHFEPDGRWQNGQLARIYRASDFTVTYLGDWHSHPRGPGRPSRRDRETAAAVSADTDARAPEPLTLLVSGRRGRWRARPYRFASGRLRRTHLAVHESQGTTSFYASL